MSIFSFNEQIGKIAYEAYCDYSKGKSLVSGCELPDWSLLKREIKNAWIAAAFAVAGLKP